MFGIHQIWAGSQFFLRLPQYPRNPLTLDQAHDALRERLVRRNEAFLDRLRVDIYGQPSSPYAHLLKHAGCELGDLVSAVEKDGLETTLERLLDAGVYLTVDEFKGRKTARRGSTQVEVRPELLNSPRASGHLPSRSGGSRSKGTPVITDLSFIRACAGNSAISLASRGGWDWKKSIWESPGAGLRFRTIKLAGYGALPEATFSQIGTGSHEIEPYFRWNLRLMCGISSAIGRPLPWPTYAAPSDPEPLAKWLVKTLASGETPHLLTFPGSAVMLARWAMENGYTISGTWLTISGEPITSIRVATLHRAGCNVIPRYGSMETGAIGYGCMRADHADDVHLVSDMFGMIQAGSRGSSIGLPPTALLMTALHPRSPFVMLNLSMGDQAEMGDRRCGCPLESVGWRSHLWNVRSFEKLTCGSVTFEAASLIPLLEELLPQQFGGGPTDYQLAESQRPGGEPLLELIVHPRLGKLPETEIREVFFAALSERSASDGMMVRRWRDAGTLQIARREPSTTRSGKISYLHA